MLLRNPRVILVCVGITLAVLAAFSLRYFSQYQLAPGFENSNLLGGPEQIALEADDVQVIGRGAGKVHWRLAAQAVTLSRDRRIVSITGIRRGALYANGREPSVFLTADRASYTTPFGIMGFSGAGALRVEGNVKAHILSPEQPSLRTQQILWDSQSNALSCPVSVVASLPKLTVAAGNAQYDSPPGAPAQGIMHLSGGVHARFDSTRGIAVLDCPGLTWNAVQQSAQTLGLVTALIPGDYGTASADNIQVNTATGDLSGHGFRGTLRLSGEVQ